MIHKRCLITGGAGFIGSHLVDALLETGWTVRVLDPCCKDHPNLDRAAGRVETVEDDFCNPAALRNALRNVDTLLHYATTTTPVTSDGNELFDVESNLVDALRLFETALKAGVSHIVFPSSGGTVYGVTAEVPVEEGHPCRPVSSHAIVKRAIESYLELLCRKYSAGYTILRYANPYGPRQNPAARQGAVAVFTGRILSGEPIEVRGSGDSVRDYIYIDDLIRATVLAINSIKACNRTFNIGSGAGLSIRELIARIEAATGIPAIVRYHPASAFDVPFNVLDIGRAKTALGWSPAVALEEGLRRTADWLRRSDRAETAWTVHPRLEATWGVAIR